MIENLKDKIEEMIFIFRAIKLKTKITFNDADYTVTISTEPNGETSFALAETIKCPDSGSYLKLKSEFNP
jgi:predicted SpoU family rRNA methylase